RRSRRGIERTAARRGGDDRHRHRREAQQSRAHYGSGTVWRLMPPEALREMTIAVVSSSLSSCSTPIMLATFSNGTPAVSDSTGVVIGLAGAKGAGGNFITPRLCFSARR